jgi:hypothetical protein
MVDLHEYRPLVSHLRAASFCALASVNPHGVLPITELGLEAPQGLLLMFPSFIPIGGFGIHRLPERNATVRRAGSRTIRQLRVIEQMVDDVPPAAPGAGNAMM